MFKLTHVSGALAALMAATVLSGCGGLGAAPVSGPTTTGSQAPTADARSAAAAAAKAKAAAQVATVQAAKAATAKAKAVADPADQAAAQAAGTAAAAVAYWRIITTFNLANAENTRVTDAHNSDPALPESFPAAARAFSAAHTSEAADLRAYAAWPKSVKPSINKFITQKQTLAGYHLKMAAAPDWDAWDKLDKQSRPGRAEAARLSGLIRQGLGLPAQG